MSVNNLVKRLQNEMRGDAGINGDAQRIEQIAWLLFLKVYDTKEECEYFVSWLNTKFTRFFVAINISKLTGIICDDCFRFVPDPGPFDHIFTDDELYRKFGLRPAHEDYIKVIESVIRERK